MRVVRRVDRFLEDWCEDVTIIRPRVPSERESEVKSMPKITSSRGPTRNLGREILTYQVYRVRSDHSQVVCLEFWTGGMMGLGSRNKVQ